MKVYIVFIALVVMGVREVEMLPLVMKQLTAGFIKVIDDCKVELGIEEGIIGDLYHLWKEEYDQVSRNTGCIFSCMSKKLDLLDGEGKLHHGNIEEYIVSNGGGKDIAAQLVPIAQECEKQQESETDECDRMLAVAKCLRTNMKEVKWTPKMQVVITEIVAEV